MRAFYVLVGFTLVAAGAGMLVLPGPAFVVIPIGLAMLSLEFVWAERMLDKALERAQVAQERAAQTTRMQRVLGAIATVFGVAAVVAAQFYWDIIDFLPH